MNQQHDFASTSFNLNKKSGCSQSCQEFEIETEKSLLKLSEYDEQFQEKCGEIYVENGKFYLVCNFCSINHESLDLFMEHILLEHLVPHNESDDCDSSCGSFSEEDNDESNYFQTSNSSEQNNKNEIYNKQSIYNINTSYNRSECLQEEQQAENISCEPDTGMFYDLEDNDLDTKHKAQNDSFLSDWKPLLTVGHNQSDDFRFQWKKESDGRYYCEYCNKNYSYSKSLKEHIDIIHKNKEKLFKCLTCSKAFSKQWKLNTHLKVHTDERPFVCSLCVMSFKWKKNLQRHLIRVHSVKYSDLIHEISREEVSLNINNSKLNLDENYEQYPIIKNLLLTDSQKNNSTKLKPCNNDNGLDYSLTNHETIYKDDEKICLSSNKLNLSQDCNTEHLNNELNHSLEYDNNIDVIKTEIIYEDDNSQHTYINKQNKNNNVNVNIKSSFINNDSLYTCKTCNKFYLSKKSLEEHIKIHNSGYKCDECDKIFTHPYFLNRHMQLHIKLDKIFKCHLCVGEFTDDNKLKKHIKLHMKKTYKCSCGTVFNIRKYYRLHRKNCKTV